MIVIVKKVQVKADEEHFISISTEAFLTNLFLGYLHLNIFLGSELYLLTLHKRQVGHGNHGSPSESFFDTVTAVNCVR